jgi:hypothetical protein
MREPSNHSINEGISSAKKLLLRSKDTQMEGYGSLDCLCCATRNRKNDKNLRKDLFPTFVKAEANAFVSREISSETRYTSQEICNYDPPPHLM